MMRVILCFTISIVWLTVADNDNKHYRFDYVYHQKAGGWLKYHEVPADFLTAFQKCRAEGAVLASPLTDGILEAMVELQKANSESCAILTGVHSTFSKGDYYSIDGVPLLRMSVSWAPDEPDNHENSEDCTIMLHSGKMVDVRCNDLYPYICFRKESCDKVTSTCGTVDKDYTLDVRTGSCYKFHLVARTWRQASMTCNAEGGHLAIINSETEAQVIRDIFAKVPRKSILSPYNFVASIGFSDWGERGVWYTVHGQTLQEAGYSSFLKGEPNNSTLYDGGSFCGGVSDDGLLHDLWCNGINFAFICEKLPDSLLSL
ncbi:unnamed protein product [Chilo suppressalis]|uniref:C-type lectin domain-containing protein n=1 Tax=Chilo suppressalis TaxID=168631 RepID=A0ABN8AXY5_CHISP|nr:unnamed protein product [Chilo suppressalis]